MKTKLYHIVLTVLLSSLAVASSQAQCPINISSVSKTDACIGQDNGTATVSVSGGSSSTYYYELVRLTESAYESVSSIFSDSPSYTFENIPPNSNYRIFVGNGSCTVKSTNFFDIYELTEIIIDANLISTTGNTKCIAPFDGTIDMTGAVSGSTDSYEYSIDGGATYQVSAVFSNLEHGTYAVRIKDSNGCTKDGTTIVVADNRVIAGITPDPATICMNSGLNLNGNPVGGTAPYTHSWTGDIGPLSATNIPNPVFNSTTAGTFDLTYTVTDASGCSASDNITVTVNPVDDPGFNYLDNNFCQSEANPSPDGINTPGGTFSATPGLIFKDSNNNDNSTTGEIDLLASMPGDYTITYKTAGSCPDSSSLDISIYEVPVANAGSSASSCSLEYTFEATPTTVGDGLWSVVSVPATGTATASIDNPSASDATVTVNETGIYRFRWEVTNGSCTDAKEIDVTFAEPIKIVQDGAYPGNCDPTQPLGWIPITVSGGSGIFDIVWSNGEGVTGGTGDSGEEDLDGNYPITNGVPSGVYTVEVTDKGTGCKELGVFVVEVSADPTENPGGFGTNLQLTGSAASCNGGGGQINLAFEGTGPYNIYYINSNADTIHSATKLNYGSGAITDEVTDLDADTYFIHIDDLGYGCSVGKTVELTEPDPIVFTFPADSVDHVTCNDGSDGAIRVDVIGGTPLASGPPPYTYLWYKDGTPDTTLDMEDPTNLVAGDYYLEVTDGNGCTATSIVITVTEPTPAPGPEASAASAVNCTEFTANWSDEGVTNYVLDVATDISFDPAYIHPDYDSITVSGTSWLISNNITAGGTYYYRVRAVEACGLTESSNIITVTTKDVVSTVTKEGAGLFCDKFTANWEEVATATQYYVEVAEDADFISMVGGYAPATVPAGNGSLNITGLAPGQQYFYRLRVENACGISDYSDTASVILPDVPNQPSNVAVENIVCDGFELSWSTVANAVAYAVKVYDDELLTNQVTQLTSTDTNVAFSGLSQATTYYFTVKASNACGEGVAYASGPIETMGPPAVPVISASTPTCTGFELSWNVVDNANEYVVEIRNPATNMIWSDTVSGNVFVADTLAVNTSYEVRLRAQNTCGDGSFSGIQSITTLPEEECGCGHEKATFVVDLVNVTCVGGTDGALMINLLPDASVSPSRFEYSLNATDWFNGANTAGLVYTFSSLTEGDYSVYIRDKNAADDCEKIVHRIDKPIKVEHAITITTEAESCDGADGSITLNVSENCSSSMEYVFIWRNTDTNTNLDGNGTEATGLVAGNYEIIIQNALGDELDVMQVSVASNCSNNGVTCELGDKTVDVDVTEANCNTGEGSVKLTVVGGESNTYTFQVVSTSGVIDETQSAIGNTTFTDLPSGDYDYVVMDASGTLRCESTFKITENIVAIGSVDYTLPECDAPEQIAELNITLSNTTTAPAPYDVYAIHAGDTVSTGSIGISTNSTTLTGLPTGITYEVVVKSRAIGTCPDVRQVEIPTTGKVDISFDITPIHISCYGEGGALTITNIVVANNMTFTVNLYKTDRDEPYASKILQLVPSSDTFTDLEKGEYQIQVIQQQTSCGTSVIMESSQNFIIEGPESELQAEIPDKLRVSVNNPRADLMISDIRGGRLPYRVRIMADSQDESTVWEEVINNNPTIDDYEYTFKNLTPGTYIVQVQDGFGCILTHNVEVQYTEALFIPNIFTPNGDGENDTFQILNLPTTSDESGMKMIITNRWGRIIYRSNNYTNDKAWDGDDYPDGIYFYRLALPNEVEAYSGWIEIWRGRTP